MFSSRTGLQPVSVRELVKTISTHRQVANLSYISDIYDLNHQQNNILHDSDCR